MPRMRHPERHVSHRTGWLRAAVLGANDGIVSTAAIIVGVAAADSARGRDPDRGRGRAGRRRRLDGGRRVRVGELAGDAERADLELERAELRADPAGERAGAGADLPGARAVGGLAEAVADELSARDDLLQVHARDELGMTELSHARPLQAAGASAAAFTAGAALPLAAVALRPFRQPDPDHDGGDDGRARRHRLGGRAPRRRSAGARHDPRRRLGDRGDAARRWRWAGSSARLSDGRAAAVRRPAAESTIVPPRGALGTGRADRRRGALGRGLLGHLARLPPALRPRARRAGGALARRPGWSARRRTGAADLEARHGADAGAPVPHRLALEDVHRAPTVLRLFEAGRLRLDDRVDAWLPYLAGTAARRSDAARAARPRRRRRARRPRRRLLAARPRVPGPAPARDDRRRRRRDPAREPGVQVLEHRLRPARAR